MLEETDSPVPRSVQLADGGGPSLARLKASRIEVVGKVGGGGEGDALLEGEVDGEGEIDGEGDTLGEVELDGETLDDGLTDGDTLEEGEIAGTPLTLRISIVPAAVGPAEDKVNDADETLPPALNG